MTLKLPSKVPFARSEINLPASIHLTSCATGDPHQAGIIPIFSGNTEAEESVRDGKGNSTPGKRNISYSLVKYSTEKDLIVRSTAYFIAGNPTESANWSAMIVK